MTNTDLSHDEANTGKFSRKVLEGELGTYGKAYGQGQNSRPAAALRCLEAAFKLPDVGPDDAKDLYTKFSQAAARARGVEYAAESSFTVQVSKLKRFLMLGVLPKIDGVAVMNSAMEVISECSKMAENPMKGSAYDNMVLVARKQIENPQVEMTKDQIREIVTATSPEKSDLDRVVDQYKSLRKLADRLQKAGVDPINIDTAAEAVADQIKLMDGEIPASTKEEIARQKALETLKSQGFDVSIEKKDDAEMSSFTLIKGVDHSAENAAA